MWRAPPPFTLVVVRWRGSVPPSAHHRGSPRVRAYRWLYFLRRLRKLGMKASILSNFYTGTTEGLLVGCRTVWYCMQTFLLIDQHSTSLEMVSLPFRTFFIQSMKCHQGPPSLELHNFEKKKKSDCDLFSTDIVI